MLVTSKKICMIGDFSVGKTSLIRRYMDNQFSDQYLTTVGVKISRKLVSLDGLSDGNSVKSITNSNLNASIGNRQNDPNSNITGVKELNLQMLIWDLEGSTRFQGIVPTYLQGASGALVVADVTRLNTIENIKSHVELFYSINPNSPIIIVLNKSDLCLEETLHSLILDVNRKMYQNTLSVLHASAKEDIGVTEAFTLLASYIIKS
jgi:small GTP-binding protein